MPSNPFSTDQAFDPEHIRAMGIAFENACRSLRLTGDDDRLTKAVASKIIQAANGGERDAERLYDAIMQWACAA
jgi:hypothetical protein